jgi:hypothetical protein
MHGSSTDICFGDADSGDFGVVVGFAVVVFAVVVHFCFPFYFRVNFGTTWILLSITSHMKYIFKYL